MKKCDCLLIFDWGDTIMKDMATKGPMYLWNDVEWVKGAESALKALSPEYLTCIATSAANSGTDEMHLALKRVGADKYFDFFHSARELGVNKPDPEFFRKVAEKAGFKPFRCIMIGDSYERDIMGAKKSGMRTIWIRHESEEKGPFKDADMIISDMTELAGAIDLLAADFRSK
jgi:FMN phosphatase YigB (HAD superfamily)